MFNGRAVNDCHCPQSLADGVWHSLQKVYFVQSSCLVGLLNQWVTVAETSPPIGVM